MAMRRISWIDLSNRLSGLRPTMSETVLRRIWQATERWRWAYCGPTCRRASEWRAALKERTKNRFTNRSSGPGETLCASLARTGAEDVMERRHFLKLAFGFAAGAAAFAASARAAPLVPHPLAQDGPLPPSNEDACH
jgi:hypothetical protein